MEGSNKGLIWAVVAILVIGVGAFLFFGNNGEDEVTETTQQVVQDEPEAPAEPTQTIAEIAAGDPNFSILVQALEAADLVDVLAGEGPFTVFAPTNEAFEALLLELGATAEELLAREDLADILTYHVLSGEVLAEEVLTLDGQSVNTLFEGGTLTVGVDGANVTLTAANSVANVTATDIRATNGVIHVIDTVLLP
jgi:transforming growth factor-beta-induced protein